MADENNENGNSTNTDENQNSTNPGDSSDAGGAANDSPKSLLDSDKYKNASPEEQRDMLVEQNRRLFARNQKPPAKHEEPNPKKPDPVPPANNSSSTQTPEGLSTKDVLKLRRDGFSEAEILEIDEQATNLGVPVSKLLSNETFKQGIEAKRKAKKVEQGTPGPTTRSVIKSSDGKPFSQLKTREERKAAFENRSVGNTSE